MTIEEFSADGADREGSIVVGVDGSDPARLALKWAADEAKLRGALLHIVYAGTDAPKDVPDWFSPGDPVLSAATAVVDDAVALVATSHPGVLTRGDIVGEPTRAALLRASETADLLVVGARGRGGFNGLLLGSVGDHCIQGASCPVVVVRTVPDHADRPFPAQRIVVGVDGSPGSDRALQWALAEAVRRRASVFAVHAWHYPRNAGRALGSSNQYESLALEVIEQARGIAAHCQPDVPFDAEIRCGPAVAALRTVCERTDLLVVGSRGRRAVHGVLIGSVAQQSAHYVECSVVVVRPSVKRTEGP